MLKNNNNTDVANFVQFVLDWFFEIKLKSVAGNVPNCPKLSQLLFYFGDA
jgi:hypothetical protein